jgi:hypothetical protein
VRPLRRTQGRRYQSRRYQSHRYQSHRYQGRRYQSRSAAACCQATAQGPVTSAALTCRRDDRLLGQEERRQRSPGAAAAIEEDDVADAFRVLDHGVTDDKRPASCRVTNAGTHRILRFCVPVFHECRSDPELVYGAFEKPAMTLGQRIPERGSNIATSVGQIGLQGR